MNRLLFMLVAAVTSFAMDTSSFAVQNADPTPWRKIFSAVGIPETRSGDPPIIVLGASSSADVNALAASHLVIVEGIGPAAHALGLAEKAESIAVRQICDLRAPKMQIIWEKAETVPGVTLPSDFAVFATEKWTSTPVMAGKRTGTGAVLWLATNPGPSGIEHFPYLLQAAVDLGLKIPTRTTTLWAFFDSAYRIRADVDYLAQGWRSAGVSVLHVAAWHNIEPDPVQDDYLKKLIEACHRHAILVYAWLELPHVSEKFWADHPDWREKTALGQDAQLDWRKLMNLQNADCRREVEKVLGILLQRFDWDGVNVAELYFESLEGASNPARFTPMNNDVRAEFKHSEGFDPKLLFDSNSPYAIEKNTSALRSFLDFRARLASRMQGDWLSAIERLKTGKPYLDVVLTHIDDRFEPGIKDSLGADVARSLPVIKAHRSTLLIEDPATLWNLGPERYLKLAEKYSQLTKDRQSLAVDINIVDRYQDVYPTKKQTGMELFQLVHQAAASFPKVALYFENSLEKQDLALLPAAATTASATKLAVDEIETNATAPTRVAWEGPVELDGKLWPLQDSAFVLAPAGRHRLRPAIERPPLTLSDFNGDIQYASVQKDRVDLSYASRSRAIANVTGQRVYIEIDGIPVKEQQGPWVILPSGQHLVSFRPPR